MRIALLAAVLCSAAVLTAQETATLAPPECSAAYYAHILSIGNEFYLAGKSHTEENRFYGSAGLSFDHVDCREVSPGVVLVTLRLQNTQGQVGEIQSGVPYMASHVSTEAGQKLNADKESAYRESARTSSSSERQGLIGKTIVLIKPAGELHAGVPVRITRSDFSFVGREGYWNVVGTSAGATVAYSGKEDAARRLFSTALPWAEFSALSPTDRKAIRSQVWEYGMTQPVLEMLWGPPDHVNDYDGEIQLVYGEGEVSSYFYFDRRGLLRSHSSHY